MTTIVDVETGVAEQRTERVAGREERDGMRPLPPARRGVRRRSEIDEHPLRAADLSGSHDVDDAHAGSSRASGGALRSTWRRASKRNQKTTATTT